MMTNGQKEMIKGAGELLAEANEKPKATKKSKVADDNIVTEKERGSRKHTILTYIDPKHLIAFLKQSSWVEHWAYCYHDKDVWTADDEKLNAEHKANTPKTAHTHIVLYTRDAKTSTAICKLFNRFSVSVYGKDKAQNTRAEYCTDICAQYRYLIHADDPNKHAYDVNERVVDDPKYWDKYHRGIIDTPNYGYTMVNDLLQGVPYRMMCERYGKEFIYHARYIEDCAQKIRLEEACTNSPISDELIKVVLKASPFYQGQIDEFFKIMDYLKETFHNEFNNPNGFEKYIKILGLGD